jgi:hypothetical protein
MPSVQNLIVTVHGATATRASILCRIPPLPHSLAQDDGR